MSTLIYHFTDLDNLASIIGNNKIACKNTPGLAAVSAAEDSVQQKRARKIVPVCQNGSLHDYVPFYFAPRSPMLYSLHKGNVETYTKPQSNLIYLVSAVETVLKFQLPYAFSNRNATTITADFFDDFQTNIGAVDWNLMKAEFWHNTEDDTDRKSRRAAEFLVFKEVPWDCFNKIGVFDKEKKELVIKFIKAMKSQPLVSVERGWYF